MAALATAHAAAGAKKPKAAPREALVWERFVDKAILKVQQRCTVRLRITEKGQWRVSQAQAGWW